MAADSLMLQAKNLKRFSDALKEKQVRLNVKAALTTLAGMLRDMMMDSLADKVEDLAVKVKLS